MNDDLKYDPKYAPPEPRCNLPVSLRDHFAAAALQGYCANPETYNVEESTMADACWRMADKMMKARTK